MPDVNNVFQASETGQKPCRSCVDFKTWSSMMKSRNISKTAGVPGAKSEGGTKEDDEKPRRTDCPLDKNELGNGTWGLLHTMAAVYPDKPTIQQKEDTKQFFTILSRLYPCEYCASDMREEFKKEPPLVDSQEEFSQWLCRFHNKVNVKLEKPEFDCSKVNQRWRDGWLDGSCD